MSHVRYLFADCRWSLDDASYGRRAYESGHIPGAAFFDVERDLSGEPGAGGRHPLPSTEQFTAAASRAGIEDGVVVVAYGSLGGAERLWWLLRHCGHDACAVIDLEAWRGPLETVSPKSGETVSFVPRERTDDVALLGEVASRLDELVMVDARIPSRWRGEPNPIDRVPGRIPGAFNAPWNEPLPDLPHGDVVAYCGSGVSACVVLHRLQLAGRAGRLYPGSWSEWEQHPELPVEQGA